MVRRTITRRRRTRNPRRNYRPLRSYINGGMRLVSPNPKPITYDPWFSMSLQFQAVSDGKDSQRHWTIKDIDSKIRTQLDLPPSVYYTEKSVTAKDQKFFILIRMQSVTVHDINNEPVGLEIYDPSMLRDAKNEELSIPFNSIWDYPGKNSWASVKAQYPAFMQRTPIAMIDDTTGGQSIFTTIGRDKSFKHLITVRLLWKSAAEMGDIIRSSLRPAPYSEDDNNIDVSVTN